MIRTQIYIEEETHKDLKALAKQADDTMAQIARDILREGVKKRKNTDTSGKNALLALTKIGATRDDPYLSENIDHYLYGTQMKKP